MRTKILIFLSLLFIANILNGQEKYGVKGIVKCSDNKEVLSGVTVLDNFSNVHTSLIMQIMKKSNYPLNVYFCMNNNFCYTIFPLSLTVYAIGRYKQLKLFITTYILDQFHQKSNPL